MDDADAMIAACNKHQVNLGVIFPNRTKPVFQEVFRTVKSVQLGELTLGLVTLPFYRSQSYYDQAAWRGTWALDGGGVLINQGIHQIDLLTWFMGDPVEIHAAARTLHRDIEVEDTFSACLRFENGAVAAINGTTTASPGFPPRIEVYGTVVGSSWRVKRRSAGRSMEKNSFLETLSRTKHRGLLVLREIPEKLLRQATQHWWVILSNHSAMVGLQ